MHDEEVLKEFEKLGYDIVELRYDYIHFLKGKCGIEIHVDSLSYLKYAYDEETDTFSVGAITIYEHELLTKLFKVWHWL